MSRRKRELSEEEKLLWSRVSKTIARPRKLSQTDAKIADVAPPTFGILASRGAGPPPLPKSAIAPKQQAPPPHRGNEKRVRRGKLEIGASLDLHGHTQATGRRALERFLAASASRGDRVVIVITGVGRGGEGVLKRSLPDWLREPPLRGLIAGFAPAHKKHGGAGAYYIFLKRPA